MTCRFIAKENDPETLVADAGVYLKASVRDFDEVTYWKRSVQGFAGPAAFAPGQLD